MVRVKVNDKELLIATDLEIEAGFIALIYRYRWQIERFFKWMKSILGNRHLMAESPKDLPSRLTARSLHDVDPSLNAVVVNPTRIPAALIGSGFFHDFRRFAAPTMPNTSDIA
jgi:hypothetical protein